jgi:hypothetical protein
MINLALQIAIIVALTLLNGLFAMSETALVSSRRARLGQRAQAGDRGARSWGCSSVLWGWRRWCSGSGRYTWGSASFGRAKIAASA